MWKDFILELEPECQIMSNSMYEWSTFPQPEFIDRSRLWNMKSAEWWWVSKFMHGWLLFEDRGQKKDCVCVSVWKKSQCLSINATHTTSYTWRISFLYLERQWEYSVYSPVLSCMSVCVCVSRPLRKSCVLCHVLGASVIRIKIRKKEWKRKKKRRPLHHSHGTYFWAARLVCVVSQTPPNAPVLGHKAQ